MGGALEGLYQSMVMWFYHDVLGIWGQRSDLCTDGEPGALMLRSI